AALDPGRRRRMVVGIRWLGLGRTRRERDDAERVSKRGWRRRSRGNDGAGPHQRHRERQCGLRSRVMAAANEAISRALIRRFAEIVGREHCIFEPEQLATYECDALTSFRVRPGLVVLPRSVEEVVG